MRLQSRKFGIDSLSRLVSKQKSLKIDSLIRSELYTSIVTIEPTVNTVDSATAVTGSCSKSFKALMAFVRDFMQSLSDFWLATEETPLRDSRAALWPAPIQSLVWRSAGETSDLSVHQVFIRSTLNG